ncbi:MAG: arginine--tRNA ligase [Candidatus Moranbacteria bacterium]|nr:arginine--tRNA ligase [Candidatus Moranbacteria bacterium]
MKREIQKIIKKALIELKNTYNWVDFELPEIIIDYPKNEQFGDYTSNIAMVLAKKLGKKPMEIAEQIAENCHLVPQLADSEPASQEDSGEKNSKMLKKIQPDAYSAFEKVEVAQPGYLNFYLSKKYLQDLIVKINIEKNTFGNSKLGGGIKVNNEFISANPTGPLTVGNGRGGFFGDCLSRVLRKAGFEVTSEYYVNDAGGQVVKLGHSVLKDDQASYVGDYIDKLGKKYASIDDVVEVGKISAKEILENVIKKTVSEKMHITFDVWMSEQYLNDEGFDQRAIEILKKKGLTYEQEGAVWLKTSNFGDDKDRVLIKSDGENAYIAGDCGYMLNKIGRGFGRIIIGLGADHHGYVSRLSAVAKALGFSGEFKISISQLVRIMKDGKEVRMSKRAGNAVYMDELIDEIGHDVARFFFLMYSHDTHMNFDLELAKERSSKNPVFYVQYAHARISSILEKARENGILNFQFSCLPDEQENSNYKTNLLIHESELSLLKELSKFPALIEEIAGDYNVHKLPHYIIKIADKFHSFYGACKVIDETNPELTNARLSLISAVKIVLAEALELIGVDAPEKM